MKYIFDEYSFFDESFSRFYSFDEIFKLQPYANPEKKQRRNQIIANVEGMIGPRDCVDKIDESKIPDFGVYMMVIHFRRKKYTYLGHSGDAVWTRCCRHIAKIFYRIDNATFPKILKKRLKNNSDIENKQSFKLMQFQDQYELGDWAYGKSILDDNMLKLGSKVAEENRTYKEQCEFASENIKFRFWSVPKSEKQNTLYRSRLCESICMLQYKVNNDHIPNLNKQDETTPAVMHARIADFQLNDCHKKDKDFFQILKFIDQYNEANNP